MARVYNPFCIVLSKGNVGYINISFHYVSHIFTEAFLFSFLNKMEITYINFSTAMFRSVLAFVRANIKSTFYKKPLPFVYIVTNCFCSLTPSNAVDKVSFLSSICILIFSIHSKSEASINLTLLSIICIRVFNQTTHTSPDVH